MSKVITTDGASSESAFSKTQKQVLAIIVNMMIPAEGDMPGAADATIFSGILVRMEEKESAVKMALGIIEEMSTNQAGGSFLALDNDEQQGVIESFRSAQADLTRLFQLCTVASYYQDDRVMNALGLEARPPHPVGYEVEQTDWSLLDPVRAKEKFYRKTSPA